MIIINDDRVDPLPVMSGKLKYPEDIDQRIGQMVEKTMVVDASSIAIECGNVRAANVVLVGILAAAIGIPEAEVEKAIHAMVPPKALDINVKAFKQGHTIGANIVS